MQATQGAVDTTMAQLSTVWAFTSSKLKQRTATPLNKLFTPAHVTLTRSQDVLAADATATSPNCSGCQGQIAVLSGRQTMLLHSTSSALTEIPHLHAPSWLRLQQNLGTAVPASSEISWANCGSLRVHPQCRPLAA